MKKRLISCILVLLILVSLLPAGALADSRVIYREIHINPLYKDVIDQKQLFSTSTGTRYLYAENDSQEAGSVDEAADILRKGMEKREARIAFYINSDLITPTRDTLSEIAEKAMEETGVPTQGDYIRWTYAGWSGQYSAEFNNGEWYYLFAYDCKYYTTAAQEIELSEKIDSVLLSLDISENSSDYDVICAIYDYICANITYDYDNLNDQDYLLKYTAYAAMVNKTAVCQGYAMLMYRMLQQEHIDCRLIPGDNHAWNIVAIDGLYYNADSTWDAGRNPNNYSYFLCGDSDFVGHTRYSEYSTEEFYNAYPMAETKYVNCPSHSYGNWTTIKEPNCVESGVETRKCANCGGHQRRDIPATGHDLVHHDGKAATCTANGWAAYDTCNRCDYTTYKEIAATGHHHNAVVTAPTCTAKGYTTHTCAACGDSYVDSYTDALGHNYGAWKQTKAPTCTAKGTETRTCTRCNASETRDVASLGHDIKHHAAKAATCTENGWAAYDTCSRCNYNTYKEIAALGHNYASGKCTRCGAADPNYIVAPELKITTSAGKPKISWNAVDGAVKYWIYRSTDGKTFKYYDSTTKTSYTNKSTTIGTTYYYKVKAVKVVDGNNYASDFSVSKSIQCKPAAPTVSINRSNGKPKLSWKAVSGATKYWIYRSTDGVNFKYFDSTTKTSYTNSGAASGTKYYYKVKAVAVVNGKNVTSANSSTKSLFTSLAKPSVSITTSNGKPKLTWKAVTGADKYYIYRSTDGKTFNYFNSTTKTTYTNSGATKNTKYYYKVKAVCASNSNANSAQSSTVSIKATK